MEPTNELSLDEVVTLIGQKELENHLLRKRIAELEATNNTPYDPDSDE